MSASTDCDNAGGTTRAADGTPGSWTQPPERFQGRIQREFPHVEADDYGNGAGAARHR